MDIFLLFLNIDKCIVVEVFGRREILEYIYPVGDEALCAVIVRKVDIFSVVLDMLEQFVVIESGIISGIQVTFRYIKRLAGLDHQHIEGQA